MEIPHFRKFLTIIIIAGLIALSFLVLKPILMSIIFGFILAFILSPLYNFFVRLTKHPTSSATIVCVLLIAVILVPIYLLTPLMINQTIKFYLSAQNTDYSNILESIFPSLTASGDFSVDFGSAIQSFVIKGGNYLLDSLSKIVLNFPVILLHLVVILFALFFALRDKDALIEYIKSLSPFSKEIESKLFKSSKEITASVLYGQVIVGIMQGIIIGIAFFIFGVPNAILLTALAVVLGVLPIIGPMFVWVPVLAYLLVEGNVVSSVGIFIFGILASNIDNILRPVFVSRFTRMHSSIVLIGMIGGLFLFGILGLILGPLILAYLLIILEVYRSKNNKTLQSSPLIKVD